MNYKKIIKDIRESKMGDQGWDISHTGRYVVRDGEWTLFTVPTADINSKSDFKAIVSHGDNIFLIDGYLPDGHVPKKDDLRAAMADAIQDALESNGLCVQALALSGYSRKATGKHVQVCLGKTIIADVDIGGDADKEMTGLVRLRKMDAVGYNTIHNRNVILSLLGESVIRLDRDLSLTSPVVTETRKAG